MVRTVSCVQLSSWDGRTASRDVRRQLAATRTHVFPYLTCARARPRNLNDARCHTTTRSFDADVRSVAFVACSDRASAYHVTGGLRCYVSSITKRKHRTKARRAIASSFTSCSYFVLRLQSMLAACRWFTEFSCQSAESCRRIVVFIWPFHDLHYVQSIGIARTGGFRIVWSSLRVRR